MTLGKLKELNKPQFPQETAGHITILKSCENRCTTDGSLHCTMSGSHFPIEDRYRTFTIRLTLALGASCMRPGPTHSLANSRLAETLPGAPALRARAPERSPGAAPAGYLSPSSRTRAPGNSRSDARPGARARCWLPPQLGIPSTYYLAVSVSL